MGCWPPVSKRGQAKYITHLFFDVIKPPSMMMTAMFV